MRLAILHLRTRRAGFAMLAVLGVAVSGAIASDWMMRVPQFGGALEHARIPAILLIPLLAASAVAAGLDSPVGELEVSAGRKLPRLRALHILLLGAVASLSLVFIAQRWDHPDPEVMLVRNLAGFTGIAFLSAVLIGGRLSWVPPLIYAMLTLVGGHGPSGEIADWAWAIQPGSDDPALLAALGLQVAGVTLVVWLGPRTGPAD